MPLVRVGPRGQVTIPSSLRRQTKISTGSFLEAEVRHNVIVLKPVRVVDAVSAEDVGAAIAAGLQDHRAGRVSGPFESMSEFKASRRKRNRDEAGFHCPGWAWPTAAARTNGPYRLSG